jgi:hypothetical protein
MTLPARVKPVNVQGWSPGVAVQAGAQAWSPGRRDLLRRVTAGTSRGSWDATELAAWTVVQRGSSALRVRDFGAVGDGVTDDSAAFIACRTALAATQHVSAWNTGGDNVGMAAMVIDPGEYLITQPEALLSGAGGARMGGWSIVGAGANITRIRFAPADPGTGTAALLLNNDKYKALFLSGITFVCSVANASFMESISSGGADNYYFERCGWVGSWRHGLRLTGSNTNSEITFNKCSISGAFTAFLFSPAEGAGGSDQFLDYDFNQCSAFLTSGSLVDIATGGNVNIWGGSFTFDGTTPHALLALRGVPRPCHRCPP